MGLADVVEVVRRSHHFCLAWYGMYRRGTYNGPQDARRGKPRARVSFHAR